MKAIFCRIDRCVGCKACELACAVEHSVSKRLAEAVGEEPRPSHRVRVLTVDAKGAKVRLRSVALQCRQCAEPACAAACIAGGIVKDETTGVVRLNSEKCVGCWTCTMVCPYGAVVRVTEKGVALKCDQCPDRDVPACVEDCPTHALVFCTPEEFEAYVESEMCDLEKEKRK